MNDEISVYLQHFRQQCLDIQLFTENILMTQFIADKKTQNAVAMSFIVLGEIANKIKQNNPDWLQSNPSIPWRIIIDFRNKIAHDYYGLDWQIVLTTAQVEIPKLVPKIEQMIEMIKD